MSRKSFSGNATPTTLSGGIGPTDTAIGVEALVGYPDTAVGPFIVTVDRGQGSLEEKIEIESYNSSTLVVADGGRGADGTTAQTHSAGASLVHTLDAGTIDEHDAYVAGNGTVAPSTSAVGDDASNGTSDVAAAADHKHARENFATGATSASNPGDEENDGESVSPARADHKHAREASALGQPMDLTGATAATRYVGATSLGAPASGTFAVGDFIIDQSGAVWVCTVAGSPGTWVNISASTSDAGSLASDYTTTGSLATFLTTASLAVGTWGVRLGGLVDMGEGAGHGCGVTLVEGTATATFEGKVSDEAAASSVTSGEELRSVVIDAIVTVTVAGTLAFQAVDDAELVHSLICASTKNSSGALSNATGYTAVKLA